MPTANINSPRRWFGPADLVISGVAVLFFVYLLRAHHPNMNRLSASAMDYGVFLVLFGIPFILLGYTVRSWIRWRRAGWRRRAAGAGGAYRCWGRSWPRDRPVYLSCSSP